MEGLRTQPTLIENISIHLVFRKHIKLNSFILNFENGNDTSKLLKDTGFDTF